MRRDEKKGDREKIMLYHFFLEKRGNLIFHAMKKKYKGITIYEVRRGERALMERKTKKFKLRKKNTFTMSSQ